MATKTILIADDDSSLCRVFTVRCRHMGLKSIVAHDALHALVLAHKSAPDLIIMDITMPAGNGLSVCEMLASDARLSHIPIIVLSGTSRESDVRRCQDLGVHFVPKEPDAWPSVKAKMCALLGIAADSAKALP